MRKTGEASTVKISRPKVSGVAPRPRLFRLLDSDRKKPVIWIAGPAGSGKTTLVASYLDSRKLPCLWYQVDEGDCDIASFFYYMGLAAKKAAPRYKKPLPLLTPEYLQSIPTFTRRYFEELYSRLSAQKRIGSRRSNSSNSLNRLNGLNRFLIVLDNFQDASSPAFHEVISIALETIPEGVTVVILSRADPAPQFARLQASNRLHCIGWEDLRFTRRESDELLKKQGRRILDEKTAALLHEKTDGWAAGIVLLIMGTSLGNFEEKAAGSPGAGKVFDYFASQIFDRTEPSVRDFLLRTSFLFRIDRVVAEKLTGNESAGPILDRLSRDHYFTYKQMQTGSVYQYHPLFREFLQLRSCAAFSPADRSLIQRKAAELLINAGQPEDAAALLRDAEDWDGLAKVVLSQAQTLITQGRSSTLEEWITCMPKELIGEIPWLLYWLAVCRVAHDPIEARGYLEKAFQLFQKEGDPSGLFLAWASIIDTFVYAWSDFRDADHWIAVARRLMADHEFPSREIEARVASGMFSILFWGRPQHPDLPKWADRLSRIVLGIDNFSMRIGLDNGLLLYYTWLGEFSKAALHFEVSRKASRNPANDPLALQWWWGVEAGYSWINADHEACVSAIANGIKLGQKTGVHMLDFFLFAPGVYSGVSLGHPEYAEELLRKVEDLDTSRTIDKALHHYLIAMVKWSRANFAGALEYGRQALRFSVESASPFAEVLSRIELAVTLFDMGRREEAGEELARALELAIGLTFIEYTCRMFRAWFALQSGDEDGCVRELRSAMALGAEQQYVNFSRWRPEMMSRLCSKALEYGIEVEYVRGLIRRRGLVPPFGGEKGEGALTKGHRGVSGAYCNTPLQDWPYPVKICTIGRFEVLIEGRPIQFSGKVQKKPLEMLKALIALGGRDVSENRLSDILWTDAEGDAAHKSLEMTLLRLRKLLGRDDAVSFQAGAMTLNAGVCHVDAQAFEALAKSAMEAWEKTALGKSKERAEEAVRLSEKALAMYQGPFLPNDAELDCTTALREKMRNMALQVIGSLGSHWESEQQWRRAKAYYRRGIEIDDLFEDFYLRLMICHENLGQRAEAVRVYGRCRKALSSALGIEPSEKTIEIYNRIRGNR